MTDQSRSWLGCDRHQLIQSLPDEFSQRVPIGFGKYFVAQLEYERRGVCAPQSVQQFGEQWVQGATMLCLVLCGQKCIRINTAVRASE